MQEKISLLFVNIPKSTIAASLSVLQQSRIAHAYYSVDSKEELEQVLDNDNSWDLLLVSEKELDSVFPTLKCIADYNRKIPFVYIAEKESNSTYLAVMEKGASDCISKNYLDRLPLIINREINHKRKADTLANAVHEMRTNLNSIVLSTNLLIKADKNNLAKQFKFASAIHHSGTHLLQYIDEFLDPDNKKEPRKESSFSIVNIHSFCQNIHQIFLPIAKEKNVHFNSSINESVPKKIKTKPVYLERILTNILSNSFKYTTEGKVILNTYLPDKDELSQINIDPRNVIAFEVKDTGMGIPADEIDYIFNRHYRISQSGAKDCDGSGLGLDICRKLTELLGGQLKVNSKVGEGTSFTLYLPAEMGAMLKTETKSEDHKINYVRDINATEALEKTILVVDDNRLHNMAIKEFLECEFNRCITANSAKEALDVIENKSVDCIVLDLSLPDAEGLQAAIRFKDKAEYLGIPIIVYTGRSLSTKERNTLNRYVDAVIQKEMYSFDVLVKAVYTLVKAAPFRKKFTIADHT